MGESTDDDQPATSVSSSIYLCMRDGTRGWLAVNFLLLLVRLLNLKQL